MSEALELAQLQQKWAALEVEFLEAKDSRRTDPEADERWDDVKHRYVHERDFWRGHQQRNADALVRDYGYSEDDPVIVEYRNSAAASSGTDTVTPAAVSGAAVSEELR